MDCDVLSINATRGGQAMSHSNSTITRLRPEPPLDAKLLDAIGRAVRAHYDDIVKAPLPDRLLDLLADLEAKERKAGPTGDADAAS
jgi:hypothetical protein